MADDNGMEPFHREMRRPGGASEAILNALEEMKLLPPEVNAPIAISGVMCVLFQRLSGDIPGRITSSLPQALREMLVPCAVGHETPERFSREEFLHRVSDHLAVGRTDAERIARGVFAAVRMQLAAEVNDAVGRQLPADLRDLWNTPPARRARPVDMSPGPPDAPSADVLQALADQGVLPPEIASEEAVGAVLCVLSQRLSSGEAGGLVDDLPPPLQPFVRPCELHFDAGDVFDRDDFIRRVAEHLDVDPDAAERITRGVFGAIKRLLPSPEVQEIGRRIPGELADMWADTGPGGA